MRNHRLMIQSLQTPSPTSQRPLPSPAASSISPLEEIGHGDATAAKKSDSVTQRDDREQIGNGNATAMRRSNAVPRQVLGCRAMKNSGGGTGSSRRRENRRGHDNGG
ncbi:hypothetical protein PIB30_040581 [Stylosanthes scabra]|uniref:Uncharacterized protein n=1 Tax=Stylosanthes scabra TaxID=79078 RepID=A0ABU6ZDD5_9FABA|nr:hypothetical protein [Stylosanthes scabra]